MIVSDQEQKAKLNSEVQIILYVYWKALFELAKE